MKTSLKNRFRILSTISRLPQVAWLLKRREFMFELKRGGHTRVQTDGGIYRLAVLVLKNLKIWSVYVVVVHGRQRNVQKSLLHVQSCCFAN